MIKFIRSFFQKDKTEKDKNYRVTSNMYALMNIRMISRELARIDNMIGILQNDESLATIYVTKRYIENILNTSMEAELHIRENLRKDGLKFDTTNSIFSGNKEHNIDIFKEEFVSLLDEKKGKI